MIPCTHPNFKLCVKYYCTRLSYRLVGLGVPLTKREHEISVDLFSRRKKKVTHACEFESEDLL